MRNQTDPKASDRLINIRTVCEMLACSQRTIYRLVDAGAIPRPLKIGGMLRWRAAEIDEWLAAGCEPARR